MNAAQAGDLSDAIRASDVEKVRLFLSENKPTDKQQPGNKKTKIDSSNKLKYDSKLKQLNVSDTTNKSIFK